MAHQGPAFSIVVSDISWSLLTRVYMEVGCVKERTVESYSQLESSSRAPQLLKRRAPHQILTRVVPLVAVDFLPRMVSRLEVLPNVVLRPSDLALHCFHLKQLQFMFPDSMVTYHCSTPSHAPSDYQNRYLSVGANCVDTSD